MIQLKVTEIKIEEFSVPMYTLNKSKFLTFCTGVYHKIPQAQELAHKTVNSPISGYAQPLIALSVPITAMPTLCPQPCAFQSSPKHLKCCTSIQYKKKCEHDSNTTRHFSRAEHLCPKLLSYISFSCAQNIYDHYRHLMPKFFAWKLQKFPLF